MLKVTVKKSEWLRGKGANASRLVALDDKDNVQRCCLGFVGLACGLTDQDMHGYTSPAKFLNEESPRDTQGAFATLTFPNTDTYENTALCRGLMYYNDDMDIDDAHRITLLRQFGAEAGIEFDFVD